MMEEAAAETDAPSEAGSYLATAAETAVDSAAASEAEITWTRLRRTRN